MEKLQYEIGDFAVIEGNTAGEIIEITRDIVTVKLHDCNGMPITRTGKVILVL